jgi:hypothetical protein
MRLKTTNKKAGLFRLSKEYCFRMMIVSVYKTTDSKGQNNAFRSTDTYIRCISECH